MEDVTSVKARHGHTPEKSFWWIEDVLIGGHRSSLQVMFGRNIIGDKTCFRVGDGKEHWFEPDSADREAIIEQGKTLLQNMLKGKSVQTLQGAPYRF